MGDVMDLEYIKREVATIEAMKRDNEGAHSCEDRLHIAFITFVAESGPPELADMAREVLKTEEIEFCRWCA